MSDETQKLIVRPPSFFDCVILAGTCLAWVAMMWVQQNWLSHLDATQAISLFFLPAGMRVLLLLSGRLPAAVGLFAGSAIVVHWVFPDNLGVVNSLAISLMTSFVPFFTIRITKHICGVDASLRHLRFQHLLIIAAAVSVVSPLAHNLWFCVQGLKPWADFAHNVLSMAVGDMLGTVALFAVIIAARVAFLRLRGVAG